MFAGIQQCWQSRRFDSRYCHGMYQYFEHIVVDTIEILWWHL